MNSRFVLESSSSSSSQVASAAAASLSCNNGQQFVLSCRGFETTDTCFRGPVFDFHSVSVVSDQLQYYYSQSSSPPSHSSSSVSSPVVCGDQSVDEAIDFIVDQGIKDLRIIDAKTRVDSLQSEEKSRTSSVKSTSGSSIGILDAEDQINSTFFFILFYLIFFLV